jgi:predicted ATPase
MITRLEAHFYRCLKSVSQETRQLEILVGPNGSGKSAFLDIAAFLCTLTAENLDAAISERAENYYDLVWGREHGVFNLSIQAAIPQARQMQVGEITYDTITYEVSVRIDTATDHVGLDKETAFLLSSSSKDIGPIQLFSRVGDRVLYRHYSDASQTVATGVGVTPLYSSLGSLPTPQSACPAGYWLKEFLSNSVRVVRLDANALRAPSPPQQKRQREMTGSNLPRMVAQLSDRPEDFSAWIDHVRTVLPDLETVKSNPLPAERRRYLQLRFRNGVEAPSWIVSEGTLRLLALTILPYLREPDTVYLIEEPENGIHPTAVEAVYQSLSSMYSGQVMAASHSPIFVGLAKPEELLCFSRTAEGTTVARGSEHPVLKDWKKDVNLSDLFAAGVLG